MNKVIKVYLFDTNETLYYTTLRKACRTLGKRLGCAEGTIYNSKLPYTNKKCRIEHCVVY